jgi:hypothetical protein
MRPRCIEVPDPFRQDPAQVPLGDTGSQAVEESA